MRSLASLVLLSSTCWTAETQTAHRAAAIAAPSPLQPPAVQLPVTRVSLYKSGVGFFEHTGTVAGNRTVTIEFTTAQLDDVLQSLTAVDLGGGRIAGAGYNSTTPIAQQLKALPLGLGEDASTVAFYNAVRGARVEVRAGTGAFAGRLLAIEERTLPPEKEGRPATATRSITVVSEGGAVRTLPLTPATEVRLLDGPLHTDVNRYLELLAQTRGESGGGGLRRLALQDNGTGARQLRVSYISEVPVWKSTYRILITDSPAASGAKAPPGVQTATLQGWSVVDNTTGADWLNVQLSLIAGAPQSFIQPLSIPYYSRRPEIPLPRQAQLTPQTHESGDPTGQNGIRGVVTDPSGAVIAGATVVVTHAATGARASQITGNDGSFSIPLGSPGRYEIEVTAPGFQRLVQSTTAVSGQMVPLDLTLNVGSASETVSVNRPMGGPVALAQTAKAARAGAFAMAAPAPPMPYEDAAAQSIDPQTSTAAFDDSFAYTLTQPITIRKNESALVPILQTRLDAERVTLWSPAHPQPLRALWITNTSGLTLDRGSFSIVEGGNFGGEGLIDPIHPGERRLLSYAADTAVRVSTGQSRPTHRVERITVAKGVLKQTTVDLSEVEYLVRNTAPQPRTVIVEHPVRPGWTIDSSGGNGTNDPGPAETTPTEARFRVQAAPGETVRLHIAERHPGVTTLRLANLGDEQLGAILRDANAGRAVLQQLEPALAARRALAAIDTQIAATDAAIKTIVDDQGRVRANLAALKATAEQRSLARRYTGELAAQEDRLTALRRDRDALQAQREAAAADLANRIEALQLDQAL